MGCSMPGFPVHHQLPELAQTHVHWASDAIQPSHPLSSPSPPAFNLAQHQGLFQRVSPLHHMAKVLALQHQHQSFRCIFRTDSFRTDWFDLFAVEGTRKNLLQHHYYLKLHIIRNTYVLNIHRLSKYYIVTVSPSEYLWIIYSFTDLWSSSFKFRRVIKSHLTGAFVWLRKQRTWNIKFLSRFLTVILSLKANNYRARSTFFPGEVVGEVCWESLLRSQKYCKFVETVSLRWQVDCVSHHTQYPGTYSVRFPAFPFIIIVECHTGLMEADLEQLLIGSSWYRQGVQTQALPGNSAVNITHPS